MDVNFFFRESVEAVTTAERWKETELAQVIRVSINLHNGEPNEVDENSKTKICFWENTGSFAAAHFVGLVDSILYSENDLHFWSKNNFHTLYMR